MSLVDELAKLEELHRSGALNDAEFTKAKSALLSGPPAGAEPHLGEHLAEIKHQNELAQIDREWGMERQQYLIRDQRGIPVVPTQGAGIGLAVLGGGFGVLWTLIAFGISGAAPDVGAFAISKFIFPLFGVVFTAGAIVYGIRTYAKAQKYQEAFAAYQARRARVKPE